MAVEVVEAKEVAFWREGEEGVCEGGGRRGMR